MQQALLEADPKARLRVYAVWFRMYPGDARERWSAKLLADPRVLHFWDEERTLGRLYYDAVPRIWDKRAGESKRPQGGVLWDSYLLFGPKARWNERTPELRSWGYTILMTRETLKRELGEALGAS